MDFSTYPLDEAKGLAASGRILISRRPRRFITQRTGRLDVAAFVQELFEALTPDDFYKSDELDVLPGVWGDVYRPIPFIEPETGESNDWYLKFFVDNEDIMINVMSANYDGYIH
jgi:hypothetical protein